MASILLETLENIENGRQHCIKKAKEAGYNATQNASLYDIGNFFSQTPTEKVEDKWQRPEDWWDTETILENATPIDGLYPAYILLLANWDKETTFSKTVGYKATQGDGYLTSDGSWYVGDATHTWDETKDKDCSLGYKTRYVIVYVANPNSVGNINLAQFPCLEFIAGNFTIKSLVFGASVITSANKNIISVKCTQNTNYSTISASYLFSYCVALENVSLPTTTSITMGYTFNNCYNLKYIDMPLLQSISGGNIFTYCEELKTLNLPSLTTISNSPTISYCTNLESISLPALTNINSNNTLIHCYNLKNVSLPALTNIGGNFTFTDCTNLESISLPALTNIGIGAFSNCYNLKNVSLPALTNVGSDMFKNCFSLEEFNFLSTYLNFNLTNMFQYCYNLKNIKLYNDWNQTGFSASDCSLTRPCLLDMLYKLADVSSETETYTLTLGATNLSKLTEEEIAEGTNKGWVIN